MAARALASSFALRGARGLGAGRAAGFLAAAGLRAVVFFCRPVALSGTFFWSVFFAVFLAAGFLRAEDLAAGFFGLDLAALFLRAVGFLAADAAADFFLVVFFRADFLASFFPVGFLAGLMGAGR